MFCVTGNILNVTPLPGFMDQGTGKAASAHMMMAAAAAYGERGYRYVNCSRMNPAFLMISIWGG